MRRCLKKGNEIKLSLLPPPTHGVPVPEAPPLPPPPAPPLSRWTFSARLSLALLSRDLTLKDGMVRRRARTFPRDAPPSS